MTAAIEFARVSRWYGPVIALNDLTVSVDSGVTGLLGPNGAGKSTFLKLCAGQLRPSQGEVRILGRRAWGTPEIYRSVGVCPDNDAFWERMSGAEFVHALLRLTGFDAVECRRRALDALAAVALMDAKDRPIGSYSKGMRQRLKLAQAIAHDPAVLLLDEPLSGMDPTNRRRVVDLIRELGRSGKTILVSSHVLHEVESMTHRVLLVHRGRLLAEGDVAEIRATLDEHPHTVAVRAREVRRFARAIVERTHVLSMSFGSEGEWVTVQTAHPDAFYEELLELAVDVGVEEVYPTDDDLESVFRYLVAP